MSNDGWHVDPGGWHELRYFDGAAWTDWVSDRGVVSVDATGLPPRSSIGAPLSAREIEESRSGTGAPTATRGDRPARSSATVLVAGVVVLAGLVVGLVSLGVLKVGGSTSDPDSAAVSTGAANTPERPAVPPTAVPSSTSVGSVVSTPLVCDDVVGDTIMYVHGAPPTDGGPPQYTLLPTAEVGQIKTEYDRSSTDLERATAFYDDERVLLTWKVASEIPSDRGSAYFAEGSVKRVLVANFTRDNREIYNALVDLDLGDGKARVIVSRPNETIRVVQSYEARVAGDTVTAVIPISHMPEIASARAWRVGAALIDEAETADGYLAVSIDDTCVGTIP